MPRFAWEGGVVFTPWMVPVAGVGVCTGQAGDLYGFISRRRSSVGHR